MSNFEELRDRLTTQVTRLGANGCNARRRFLGSEPNIFDPSDARLQRSGYCRICARHFPETYSAGRLNPVSHAASRILPRARRFQAIAWYATTPEMRYRPTDSDQFNQRIDWIENKIDWFGRYSWGNDSRCRIDHSSTDAQHVATTVRQGMLSNALILSSSTVNEARFAWNQFNNDLVGYFANTQDVQADLGIHGLFSASPLAYGVPAIGLGGGVNSFGGVTPWVTRDDTFQFMDNVSILSRPTLAEDGEKIRRDRYNQFGNQKATGEFLFDGQSTFDPANRNATGLYLCRLHAGRDLLIRPRRRDGQCHAAPDFLLRLYSG